jgi:hypothetical protein
MMAPQFSLVRLLRALGGKRSRPGSLPAIIQTAFLFVIADTPDLSGGTLGDQFESLCDKTDNPTGVGYLMFAAAIQFLR